jgi:hypothetical protein
MRRTTPLPPRQRPAPPLPRRTANCGGDAGAAAGFNDDAYAGAGSADIDDLAELADLKAHGDISEADYARARDKILH